MDDLAVLKKDPDLGYLGNWLWLPKSKIKPEVIKAALTFSEEGKSLAAWEATRYHLLVPRRFYDASTLKELEIPIVSLLPDPRETQAWFKSKKALWERAETNQVEMVEASVQALLQYPGTCLHVGCGKGKSLVSLELASRLQQRTLILIPGRAQIQQWREEVEDSLEFRGTVGILQPGKKPDWEHDITIAMMDTVESRMLDLPPEFFHYWGLVIFDEVHSVGANARSHICALFPGKRFGITATYKRADGKDAVYRYHIGPPCYIATQQEIRPKISFLYTPVQPLLNEKGKPFLPDECYSKKRSKGENGEIIETPTVINHNLLCGWLDEQPERIEFIVEQIEQDLREGKKIVVLSKRKALIHEMKHRFGEIAVAVDVDTPDDQRVLQIRNSRVAFCTDRIGAQAVNDPMLDTLHLIHSTKSDTQIIQAFGRVQRVVKNKGEVEVKVYEDKLIWPIHQLCKKTRKIIGGLGYSYTLVPYLEDR
jgi:superfamily II DNA or RNA helicase